MNYSNQSHRFSKNSYNKLLSNYQSNPLFIIMDISCSRFMRRFKVRYIVWQPDLALDMRLYQNREIWILYGNPDTLNIAINIGRKLQLNGALKVLVMLIDPYLLKDNQYGR